MIDSKVKKNITFIFKKIGKKTKMYIMKIFQKLYCKHTNFIKQEYGFVHILLTEKHSLSIVTR